MGFLTSCWFYVDCDTHSHMLGNLVSLNHDTFVLRGDMKIRARPDNNLDSIL